MTDLFAPVPLRFLTALVRGEIDADEFAIGCYLALRSFEALNTSNGVVLLRVATLLADLGWPENRDDTARRKLTSLKEKGWIAYEVKERQRAPWEIT